MVKNNIKPYLDNYIQDPINPEFNYWLGYEYEKIGQYASALSYYLRGAELSNDENLTYDCLLKTWFMLHKTKRRPVFCKKQLLVALTQNPKRPEAYFLLSRLHEKNEEWVECHYYASTALKVCDLSLPKSRTDIEYPGDFILDFQYAFSSWHIGQIDECKILWKNFIQTPNLPKYYFDIAQTNLKNLGVNEKDIPPHKFVKKQTDIILQGPYNKNVLETAKHYLKLEFINNVIISCWQEDSIPNVYPSNIIFIQSPLPSSTGTDNRNLQIISSLKGLKYSQTEYAIKMRNDQKYDLKSMEIMYNFFNSNKEIDSNFDNDQSPINKILVAGVFAPLPFHPRDHIFWGNRKDLIKLFSCPLEQISIHEKANIGRKEAWKYTNYYVRSESYLGSYYASNFNNKVKQFLLKPEEYLFDNSPKWQEALDLSNTLTKKLFKSFPREGIDLEWPKNNWPTYPYNDQSHQYQERWHEDGY